MFGFFKTKGFNFKSTHITEMKKISRLIILLAVAYSWSIKIGQWKEEFIAPIKIKKHGRKEISVFRYGLDCIRETILSSNPKIKRNILKLLKLLTPNYKIASN